MSFTIHFGWWLLPAALTLFLVGWAARYTIKRGPLSGDYDFGADIAFVHLAAICGSCFVWAIFFAILYFTKP